MTDFSVTFIRLGGYSFDEATIIGLVGQAIEFLKIDLDAEKTFFQVEATFIGGDIITSKKVEEILQDSYVKSKPIVQLAIRSMNTEAKPLRRVTIVLRDSQFGEGVNVNLTADRASCTLAGQEMQNIIDGCRQWYSRIYISGGWLLLFALFWCSFIGALSGILLNGYLPGQVAVAVIGALISSSVLGIGGIYVMRRMFPRVIFEMGLSKRRMENARLWRKTIGSVVILGIVVAVIGGSIVEWIKTRP